MGKMILAFIALFLIFFVGIQAFVTATGREKIELIKVLSYAMLITVLVLLIISTIVILF